VANARPAGAIQTIGAERPITKEEPVGTEWTKIVNRVYDGLLDILDPMSSEVREEVVNVHQVGRKSTERVEGVSPTPGSDPKRRACGIEAIAFKLIGVRSKELH
jgi:hypothetical protein